MYTLIVSDLHLTDDDDSTAALFIKFCQQHNGSGKVKQLFILGDLFNVWLGDDISLTSFPKVSAVLKNADFPIFIIRGNRDFLLGHEFAQTTHTTLINEPYLFDSGEQCYLFMHGDTLCTDDKGYQRFRKIVRNTVVQQIFLALPSGWRRAIGRKLRSLSVGANGKKDMDIMDVNTHSVNTLMKRYPKHHLIHGHTHRQNIHQGESFNRYVLGDWQPDQGNALKIDSSGIEFITV